MYKEDIKKHLEKNPDKTIEEIAGELKISIHHTYINVETLEKECQVGHYKGKPRRYFIRGNGMSRKTK